MADEMVEKWYVSDILDDGRYGIVSHSNAIIYGLRFRLTKELAHEMVELHNRIAAHLLGEGK